MARTDMSLTVIADLGLTATRRISAEKENGTIVSETGLTDTISSRRRVHSLVGGVNSVSVDEDRSGLASRVIIASGGHDSDRSLHTRRSFTTSRGRVFFSRAVSTSRRRVRRVSSIPRGSGSDPVIVKASDATWGISAQRGGGYPRTIELIPVRPVFGRRAALVRVGSPI